MKMKVSSIFFAITLACAATAASTANAAGVTWANLTSWNSSNQLVSGNIGSITVTMKGNGDQIFTQYSNSIWTPTSTYVSSFGNGPSGADIIGLNSAGTETITFSQSVKNPLIALMSWNDSVVSFGNDPIKILNMGGSSCCWGAGSIVLNAAGTGFNGIYEANGVIEVLGTYKTITFTDKTNEYWHGYTVGITPTPEPEEWAMMLLGFGMVGFQVKRKKAAWFKAG